MTTSTAGATLSITGRFAVQGEQARRGLTLWSEHMNQSGGLLNVSSTDRRSPVELLVYDDRSKIAGATAAIERLIVEDRVDLLLSPYSSVLTIAAAEVSERHGKVLWNHGGSSDALEHRELRRVVTLLSPASRYLAPVLDLAVERGRADGRAVRSVALLHGATGTFPKAVTEGARAHARNLGLEIVLDSPYPPSADDMPALVRALAELCPDVILGVGATEADLAFAREIRRQSVMSTLLALVAAPIQLFREALGDEANGFCGPSQWEPTVPTRPDLGPTSAEFSAAFRARFGLEPDYPAAQAYAAGLIAAHCVDQAGSFDDAALRRAAGALDLTTFYGRFRLDPRTGQQAGHEMVVVQWQSGRKEVVWPLTSATAWLQLPVPTAAPTPRPSDGEASS